MSSNAHSFQRSATAVAVLLLPLQVPEIAFAESVSPPAKIASAPIAPLNSDGVSVGMTIAQITDLLAEYGYTMRDDRGSCLFGKEGVPDRMPGMPVEAIRIPGSCAPDEVAAKISYSLMFEDSRDQADALMSALAERIGAEPTCRRHECAWHDPGPGISLIRAKTSIWGAAVEVEADPASANPQNSAAADERGDPAAVALDEVKLLAPSGVSVGMPLAEVHATLLAAGFEPGRVRPGTDALPCEWHFDRELEHRATVSVATVPTEAAASRELCLAGVGVSPAAGAVVRDVRFEKHEYRAEQIAALPSAEDMIEHLAGEAESLGLSADDCTIGIRAGLSRYAVCTWAPQEPGIATARVEYGPYSPRQSALTVQLTGAEPGRP